jgi:flagellar biosynthesis protein FlhB
MEESELDKSEQATPFKLKKAREKGSVARSLDLGFFAALAGALGFFWMGGAALAFAIAQSSRRALVSAGEFTTNSPMVMSVIGDLFAPVVYPLIAFSAALFFIAIVLDFLQVGPVFSATPLKPDFKRINPAQGLKRLMSWRMLIESAKAVVKLCIYSTIAWLVIRDAVSSDSAGISGGYELAGLIFSTTMRLIMFCALAALAIAAIDQMLVRREFAKKMRMSHREVKREHRDREGEPRQRQKRKQLHQEFVKAVQGLRNVKGSDIIITNPEHYAVALRYDAARMSAPMIVARGAGEMAQRIKRLGFVYGVVTVRAPELARALFHSGKVLGEVPDDHYQQVADLYLKFDLVKKGA